jgi:myosin heavy subunit
MQKVKQRIQSQKELARKKALVDEDDSADCRAVAQESSIQNYSEKQNPDENHQVNYSQTPIHLNGLQKLLEDAAFDIPGMPMSNRQMLAAVCGDVIAEVRTVPSAPRHEFVAAVLEMISEALSEMEAAQKETAQQATKEAEAIANDSRKIERLANACQASREALETSKGEVSQHTSKLSALREDLARATLCEKAASGELASAEIKEKAAASKKHAADAAFKVFQTLEAKGPIAKNAEVKRMCKEIETHMVAIRVHENLFPRVVSAVIPALQTKPEDRSRYEEGALSALEGCLTTYTQEQADAMSKTARDTAACLESLRCAEVDAEGVRRSIETCNELASKAKARQKSCDAAHREAEGCRREHKEQVARLRKRAKMHTHFLKEFGRLKRELETLLGDSPAESGKSH